MHPGKNETMRKSIFRTGLVWLWVAFLVIVLDRLSKTWMVQHLIAYEPLQILPIFNFTLAYNTGAAFSFLHSAAGWQTLLFSSLALVVSAVIIYWLAKASSRQWWMSIALTLILGGALGNAWDRWLYGHVIDFLDFHLEGWHFAIFNMADSAICVGTVMLLLNWMVTSPANRHS